MDIRERTQKSILDLRQLACLVESPLYEPRRLFKEIEKDANCNTMLRNFSIVKTNPKTVEYYNAHVRQSRLSDEDKKKLIIAI